MSALPQPKSEGRGWTMYLGDCRTILPVHGVDAVVTDPPYGVAFGGKATKHTSRSGVGYASTDDTECNVRDVVVSVVESVIATVGRVVVTPGVRCAWLYPRPDALGTIFYPSGAGVGRWGFTCSQPILYYGRDPYTASGLGSRPDSFATTEAAECSEHPCPKPLGTMVWLVAKASLPAECVLDPFAGSGTTGVACLRLGRRFIGIEKDPKYYALACERLRAEENGSTLQAARAGQLALLGGTQK